MRTIETIADAIATGVETNGLMKALVYGGPGQRTWQSKPKPVVRDPGDAVVRITTTTICGTDLHILKGDVPTVTAGRILGHEGVGIIEAVGPHVSTFRTGDRVLISCISACGICDVCRKGMYSHCRTGGWILGNTIDGTQAEFVRTPHADTSLYHLPMDANEEAMVMLSDILPTGFECGVLNGKLEPGDTVAIVGAGPIGLAALLTAQFYSPAAILMIDLDDNRLRVAEQFGATALINSSNGTAVDQVMGLTAGSGVDVGSRRSAFPPPSTSVSPFSRQAAASRTWAFTGSPCSCISKHCGIGTSRSPRGSWTRRQYPCCSNSCGRGSCSRQSSSLTASPSATSSRPTTRSGTPRRNAP